jgi:hypothetical protein
MSEKKTGGCVRGRQKVKDSANARKRAWSKETYAKFFNFGKS